MMLNVSPHIFLDVDVNSMDMEKNGVFVLQRVLQYGLLKDWLIIKSNLGCEKMKSITVQIPTLDDV